MSLPRADRMLSVVCEDCGKKSKSISPVLPRAIVFAFYYLIKDYDVCSTTSIFLKPVTLKIHIIQSDF